MADSGDSSPLRSEPGDGEDQHVNEAAPNGSGEEFDDLFGDGSGEEATQQHRHLDDPELDSGDDLDRNDRQRTGAQSDDGVDQQYLYIGADLPRSYCPKPSDKEFYLMKVPPFLAFEPTPFTTQSLHENLAHAGAQQSQSSTLASTSSFDAAMGTVRWRYSPSNPSEMQSNCRMVRWSDGSLTMQFASEPCTHYKISANALAPPQRNPPKPTPLAGPGKRHTGPAYDPALDSFTYLCAPSLDVGVVRIVQKVTTGLTVAPPKGASTAAFEQLRISLKKSNTRDGIQRARTEDVRENPEVARKKIEAAEKDKQRLQRRIESQQLRERDRTSTRAAARSGRASGYGSDGESGYPSRSGTRRGYADVSDDDGGYRAGPSRSGGGRRGGYEDEDDDDFIAKSDEEEEEVGLVDTEDEEIRPRSKKSSGGSGASGRLRKKRRVIDDEEENDDDEE